MSTRIARPASSSSTTRAESTGIFQTWAACLCAERLDREPRNQLRLSLGEQHLQDPVEKFRRRCTLRKTVDPFYQVHVTLLDRVMSHCSLHGDYLKLRRMLLYSSPNIFRTHSHHGYSILDTRFTQPPTNDAADCESSPQNLDGCDFL